MANNYTQFSVALPSVDLVKLKAFLRALETDDEDEGLFLSVSHTIEGNSLRLYAEENGDVHAAATIIKRFLDRFDIGGGVYMSWAETCSKMRVNEFSGGSVVVTRSGFLWNNAFDIVKEAAEQGITIINA